MAEVREELEPALSLRAELEPSRAGALLLSRATRVLALSYERRLLLERLSPET